MAGNVTYMNGAQLQAAISAANQAVSGMTYAEAVSALGGAAQTSSGGLTSITTFPLKYQEYGQVSIEAQYAAQLWEYWKTVAGAEGTTVLGAAAGAAVSYANGVLIGTGEGLAATAGLLTLSVPTAVAMAAPLLGVGLGEALYNTNPELWTNISNGLVDFVTEGTQTITALIDEAGHVLLDKLFVDKLKDVLEENDVPLFGEVGKYLNPTVSGFPNPLNLGGTYTWTKRDETPMTEYNISGTAALLARGGSGLTNRSIMTLGASLTENGVIGARRTYNATTHVWGNWQEIVATTSYTYDGRTIYYTAGNTTVSQSGHHWDPELQVADGYPAGTPAQVAWEMIYGDVHQATMPDGTNIWNNPLWNPTPASFANMPTYPVYNPETQTTQPYYPVPAYVGDTPGTSVDPATTPQPDPTSPITPAEWPVIEPYIPPVVNPEIQWPDAEEVPVPDPVELTNPAVETDPIYVPKPDLDPATNPSTLPQNLPDPNTAYPETDGEPPQDTGDSPPIIFPIPDLAFPTISPEASDTPVVSGDPGFVQVYHPSPSELLAFGRWLWVTYADATIDKIWNNPFDGVIGCHELYATPTDGGYTTIRCGFLDSGISSQLVRIRYSTINCGSMIIPEYWGNYLDYSPYTKAYIYLPFIGIQELDADDVVGHAVNVCYHIDAYNGSCIAQITCAKDNYENTLYQFSGNCAVEYPLSGGSQAAIKAAMMTGDAYQTAANTSANAALLGGIGSGLASAIGGIASGIATGLGGSIAGGIGHGIGGIASGIGQAIGGYASSVGQRAYGQAQHTANMLSGKAVVQHSGNFGASYGAMGIKKPYIFVRRPIQKVVNNYNILYGYPAHKQVVIGNCTGFLRCREVSVVSPLATEDEKILIEQLLTTGVYVTDEFSQLNYQ